MSLSESEDAIGKMRRRLSWLYSEILRQSQVGNHDTARHFLLVARESENLLAKVRVYVARNPDATKREILALLSDFKR